jgi:hypothetical protein
MKKSVTIIGSIQSGKMLITNREELADFFRKNEGSKLIVTYEAIEPGSSVLQRSYFRKAVLPVFQRGFYELGEVKSLAECELFILNTFPMCKYERTVNGRLISDVIPLDDMSQRQMSQLIDACRIFSGENFGLPIMDSITIENG